MTSDRGPAIIGGTFGIEELLLQPSGTGSLDGACLLAVNARSAMFVVADTIRPKRIWLPSYLCDVILEAFSGFQIRYYGIGRQLQIESEEWVDTVEKGDLVVMIAYFGFAIPARVANRVAERGAFVLEDASQAFFSSHIRRNAHFTVVSPRKHLGVPDGGILYCRSDMAFEPKPTARPPAQWWARAYKTSADRRLFDLGHADRSWFELFRDTDRNAPVGYYHMSELSEIILGLGFDASQYAERRRRNYRELLSLLARVALVPDLPDDVVPLGFPIVVNRRDELRKRLFADDVYPPVHWQLHRSVPETYRQSHWLSRHVMTIPCDQRYSPEDMKYVAETIRRELQ